MAVAHSAASESHTGTTGSTNQASFNWTHTQTGTPQGVVVFVHTISATDTVTSVTYGSVTLTRVTGGAAIDSAGEPGRTDLFFAGSGLGTGNQTITVNRTNNATEMYASAATVTAGANTAIPGSPVLLQGDGTLTEQNVGDTSPGQNSVRYAAAYYGGAAPPAVGANSTLLTGIDFGGTAAAMARETTAGQGSRPVGFADSTDDRAAVHIAIRELVPRTETPIVGSFSLTGHDATLSVSASKAITADVGIFTLTGNAADLRHNVQITGDVGTFTLTGNDATLSKASARELLPVAGVFSLNGNQAGLAHGVQIAGDGGQFTLTGNQAGLAHGYATAGDTGTFSLTGNAATLTKAAADELSALVGAFTLASNGATLTRSRLFTADRGQFTLTGQPASLLRGWRTTGDRGQFLLTGNPATLAAARSLLGATGAFTLTGNPAGLSDTDQLDAVAGAFILSGLSVELAKTGVSRRRNVLIF